MLNSSRIQVGVDLVEVCRVVRLVTENPGIVDIVFTPRENAYCTGKRRCYEHMAARFAAKEAVFKVFGTGLGRRMNWTDVEIINDVTGKPYVYLYGEVAALAKKRGLTDIDISLTHTAGTAIALAVAVWEHTT